MAMPRRSFSCTAGLHEFGNWTLPSLSPCWPTATLAAATERAINTVAIWLRMFICTPPIRNYPGAAILPPNVAGNTPLTQFPPRAPGLRAHRQACVARQAAELPNLDSALASTLIEVWPIRHLRAEMV